MIKTLRYEILSSTSAWQLERDVEERARQGWNPIGGLVMGRQQHYMQAMALQEEKDDG